jgi:hypothetical protein
MTSDVDGGGNISSFFDWPNLLSSSLTIEYSNDTREIVQVPYFLEDCKRMKKLVFAGKS